MKTAVEKSVNKQIIKKKFVIMSTGTVEKIINNQISSKKDADMYTAVEKSSNTANT